MALAQASIPHITQEYVDWLRQKLPRRDYDENTSHATFLWTEAQYTLFSHVEQSVRRSMAQNINREIMGSP